MISAAAVGAIAIYLLVGLVLFLIAAAILRLIFRINRIVELLSSIDARLRTAPSPLPTVKDGLSTVDEQSPMPSYDAPFETRAIDLSVGDKIVDIHGGRFQIIKFRGRHIAVKDEAGRRWNIYPIFPWGGIADRIYPVRKKDW